MSRQKLHGLHKLGPCSEGRAYLRQHRTLQAAWDNCTNRAFMEWYLAKTYDPSGVAKNAEHLWVSLRIRHRHSRRHLKMDNEIVCNFIRRIYPQPPPMRVYTTCL